MSDKYEPNRHADVLRARNGHAGDRFANGGRLERRNQASDLRFRVERVTGIEPALSAWEADVLPLNYTRVRPTRSEHGRRAMRLLYRRATR